MLLSTLILCSLDLICFDTEKKKMRGSGEEARNVSLPPSHGKQQCSFTYQLAECQIEDIKIVLYVVC